MRRHLVERPILFAMAFLVASLVGWAGNIWPVTEFTALALANLAAVLSLIPLVAAFYTVGILWHFSRELRPHIAAAAARVTQLDNQFQFTATQLLNARNAHQLFRYELYAWRIRRDVVARLIETAQSRVQVLTERLGALRESADIFVREREDSLPLTSPMRRPLIVAEDIDAYYSKMVKNAKAEGEVFVSKHGVTRSLVRRITPEAFRERLRAFAVERFKHLRNLCITDAIFHYPDLVPERVAELRLRELDEAAEPLLRLRPSDGPSASRLAQRNTTLWVSAQECERMLEVYRRICPGVNVHIGDDDSSLRVLTRCLYFPAYFIGSIEFYHDRYTRSPHQFAAELPDVLPLNERLKRAHKRFLLALAMGVVVRDRSGVYTFHDGHGEPFGTDSRQIAERLSGSLGAQKVYEELDDRLDRHLERVESVINLLREFLNSAKDLTPLEHQILTALLSEYF